MRDMTARIHNRPAPRPASKFQLAMPERFMRRGWWIVSVCGGLMSPLEGALKGHYDTLVQMAFSLV